MAPLEFNAGVGGTFNVPGIRPSSSSSPSNSGRRLAGQKPPAEYDPNEYLSRISGNNNTSNYGRQIQDITSSTLQGIRSTGSGILNQVQGYGSMTGGNNPVLTGRRTPGSTAELNSAANTATQMREGNQFLQGMQNLFMDQTPRYTQVNGRQVQSSALNANTFRDMSGLEDIRNDQQNSLAGKMDWMKQQDWNRDQQALVMQANTSKDMQKFGADLSLNTATNMRNLGAEGGNLQQAQIDSDANYARQRQMSSDARNWEASHQETAGTRGSNPMAMSSGGGGGGGGGGYTPSYYGSGSTTNFDPYEMMRIQALYNVGMAQVDAQNRASMLQRDASNYGSYMNASISRH